jgi:hypothetical protein
MNGRFLQLNRLVSHIEQLLKMYIGGLKDYICSEIKLWRPKTIEDARQATKLIEQKNKVNKYTLPHMRDDDKHRR